MPAGRALIMLQALSVDNGVVMAIARDSKNLQPASLL
jgi:hypothetical protein